MERILKSIQRDPENFLRERQKGDVFSVEVCLSKDGMFFIVRRQEKDPVLCIIDLHKKSGVFRSPHQVNVGELVVQSSARSAEHMGCAETGAESGADCEVCVRLILFRLVDIRCPAFLLP